MFSYWPYTMISEETYKSKMIWNKKNYHKVDLRYFSLNWEPTDTDKLFEMVFQINISSRNSRSE